MVISFCIAQYLLWTAARSLISKRDRVPYVNISSYVPGNEHSDVKLCAKWIAMVLAYIHKTVMEMEP